MADPRDYVMQAGQMLQGGLSEYAAQKRQEEALNAELPEWVLQQMYPMPSAQPVGAAVGKGLGNVVAPPQAAPAPGTSLGMEARAAALGRPAPVPEQGRGLGQEDPEIEAAAKEYAAGRISMEEALSRGRQRLRVRDLPSLQFGLQVKESNAASGRIENQLAIEEERTRRALGVQGSRNEGGLSVQEKRNEGGERVATIKAGAQVQGHAIDAKARVDAAIIAARALVMAAESRLGASDPVLKAYMKELDSAGKELQTASGMLDVAKNLAIPDRVQAAQTKVEAADARLRAAEKTLKDYAQQLQAQPPPQGASSFRGSASGPAYTPQGTPAPAPQVPGPSPAQSRKQQLMAAPIPPGARAQFSPSANETYFFVGSELKAVRPGATRK